MAHRFVDLPRDEKGKTLKTYLYKKDRKKKVRQVLWGDWLTVDGEEPDGYLRIIWGSSSDNPETLFIPKAHTTNRRPLEIIFLDVGQGDGSVLITPERDESERIFVIDAGISNNMYEFLRKRFRPYKKDIRFHAAIITHPDIDHYGGFEAIFQTHSIGFDKVYHNGLVERPVSGQFEKLGGLVRDPRNNKRYVRDLAVDSADMNRLFAPPVDAGNFGFPNVIQAAIENPNVGDFAMLSTMHGVEENGRKWMPGFAPSDNRGYQLEVLGPVVETAEDGKPQLRKIGGYGETKNGHSILLRLHYGGFKVLFGGDLNEKAEKFLLTHYAGLNRFPQKGTAKWHNMIDKAAGWFRSEMMKVCHHGSEKVTDAFLMAVEPAAFVISSGDEEGHVHPRPDLLGRLGKQGRSDTPVILSTELQRSTRENEDEKLVRKMQQAVLKIADKPTEKLRNKIIDDIWTLGRSNVSVYGTIYLKTDGERLLVAFRVETSSQTKKWFTFEYRLDDNRELVRV